MPFPAISVGWEYPMRMNRTQEFNPRAPGGGIESKSQKPDPETR
jgi:hypothetical protein